MISFRLLRTADGVDGPKSVVDLELTLLLINVRNQLIGVLSRFLRGCGGGSGRGRVLLVVLFFDDGRHFHAEFLQVHGVLDARERGVRDVRFALHAAAPGQVGSIARYISQGRAGSPTATTTYHQKDKSLKLKQTGCCFDLKWATMCPLM